MKEYIPKKEKQEFYFHSGNESSRQKTNVPLFDYKDSSTLQFFLEQTGFDSSKNSSIIF